MLAELGIVTFEGGAWCVTGSSGSVEGRPLVARAGIDNPLHWGEERPERLLRPTIFLPRVLDDNAAGQHVVCLRGIVPPRLCCQIRIACGALLRVPSRHCCGRSCVKHSLAQQVAQIAVDDCRSDAS
jgi:hypothetical protein